MPPHRDLAAYDDRAGQYDRGWRGRLHHAIGDRTAALATSTAASPQRVLDVGCGTGYLLRTLAGRYPEAEQFAGIDAAPNMIETARRLTVDQRLTFSTGVAERLPYPDASIDLVVSSTSFDHWTDQYAGLGECARVLRPGGRVALMVPTAGRAAQLWKKLPNVGAHVFGEDEIGDILEDHGFASVRTKNVGTIQWVRAKRG